MTPETTPQVTKSVNKWKNRIHSKTIVFTLFLAPTATAFSSISSPGSSKASSENCLPLWQPKSQKNHENLSKVDSKEGSQINPKINKMKIRTSRCPFGVPLDPRIMNMVAQAPEKVPQGLQNDSFQMKN